jgi:hypothetical protein
VFGGGFATFTPELYNSYALNLSGVHGPHSIYFGVLAEHGFVGLFLYLTLLGSCFLTTRWVAKWARFHGDEVARNYAHMFQFSLVGFVVSGCFLGRAYFDYFFTLVACIAVLGRVCRQAWGEAIDDEEPAEGAATAQELAQAAPTR